MLKINHLTGFGSGGFEAGPPPPDPDWFADRIIDFNPTVLDVALNNNDPVTSWASSVGSYVAANSSGVEEPQFKTAIANGQPAVDFSVGGVRYLNINNNLGSPAAISIGLAAIQKGNQTGSSSRIISATTNWLIAFQ